MAAASATVISGRGIGPRIAGTSLTFAEELQQYCTPRELMPAFSVEDVPDEDVFDIYTWLRSLGEE